jgi:hypothetical protein
MRPAPRLTGAEGLHPAGQDGFGPVALGVTLSRWLDSLWSGSLLLHGAVRSMTPVERSSRSLDGADLTGDLAHDLATNYEVNAARWHGLARHHPGSAALWLDLGNRAANTARRLA